MELDFTQHQNQARKVRIAQVVIYWTRLSLLINVTHLIELKQYTYQASLYATQLH